MSAGYPLASLSLCARCGAAIASERDRCGACGNAYAVPAPITSLEPERRWARISCQFRCASCGVLSPLNQLDLGPNLSCAQCGFEQALDARVWSRVLAMAHDIVDLAASDRDVREAQPPSNLALDNPYRAVGLSMSEWAWSEPGVIAGRQSLELRVGPGHPLCDRCGSPRQVALRADGVLASLCPRCSASASFAAPSAARGLYPQLEGVLAAAHRTDTREANASFGANGVVKLSCPQCGAPLEPGPRETSVTCSHCQVRSLLSNKLWFRLGVREPFLEPFWVVFRGRSQRRRRLENASAKVDPLEQEIMARARAVLAETGGAPPPTPMVPPGIGFVPALPPRTSSSSRAIVLVLVAFGFAALAAVGALVAFYVANN